MLFDQPVAFCPFYDFLRLHFRNIHVHILFRSLSIVGCPTLAVDTVRDTLKQIVSHSPLLWEAFRMPDGYFDVAKFEVYLNQFILNASLARLWGGTRGTVLEGIIRDAFLELDPKSQYIIYLCYYDNLSDLEIAERLLITPGIAKARRYQAKEKLRDILRKKFPDLQFPDDFA